MVSKLHDSFGRSIEYLRISVTDRCDLRCHYCMPADFNDFPPLEEQLSDAEIIRISRLFSELGTHRIRLTGGEPLVRHGLPQLVQGLSELPAIDDLSLSTNATRLASQAQALHRAGISRINVSLDTLRPERFKAITRGKLEKVLRGLMAAKDAGFHPIKINMVVMKDINDDEVEAMVDFCLEHDFTLRFIETMPMGDTGRQAGGHYLSLQEVQARLARRFTLLPGLMPGGGPARYVRVAGTRLQIGFITPLSQHFCETCNRVRLASDGTLFLCLGQDDQTPLRPLLRAGISDTELKQHIVDAIARKPARHDFLRQPGQLVRFMNKTGG